MNSKTQVRIKEAKATTISQCQGTNLQHKKETSFRRDRIRSTAPQNSTKRILPCSLPPSQCCHQVSLSSSSVAKSFAAVPLRRAPWLQMQHVDVLAGTSGAMTGAGWHHRLDDVPLHCLALGPVRSPPLLTKRGICLQGFRERRMRAS